MQAKALTFNILGPIFCNTQLILALCDCASRGCKRAACSLGNLTRLVLLIFVTYLHLPEALSDSNWTRNSNHRRLQNVKRITAWQRHTYTYNQDDFNRLIFQIRSWLQSQERKYRQTKHAVDTESRCFQILPTSRESRKLVHGFWKWSGASHEVGRQVLLVLTTA